MTEADQVVNLEVGQKTKKGSPTKNQSSSKKAMATPEERVARALKSKLSFERREEELR